MTPRYPMTPYRPLTLLAASAAMILACGDAEDGAGSRAGGSHASTSPAEDADLTLVAEFSLDTVTRVTNLSYSTADPDWFIFTASYGSGESADDSQSGAFLGRISTGEIIPTCRAGIGEIAVTTGQLGGRGSFWVDDEAVHYGAGGSCPLGTTDGAGAMGGALAYADADGAFAVDAQGLYPVGSLIGGWYEWLFLDAADTGDVIAIDMRDGTRRVAVDFSFVPSEVAWSGPYLWATDHNGAFEFGDPRTGDVDVLTGPAGYFSDAFPIASLATVAGRQGDTWPAVTAAGTAISLDYDEEMGTASMLHVATPEGVEIAAVPIPATRGCTDCGRPADGPTPPRYHLKYYPDGTCLVVGIAPSNSHVFRFDCATGDGVETLIDGGAAGFDTDGPVSLAPTTRWTGHLAFEELILLKYEGVCTTADREQTSRLHMIGCQAAPAHFAGWRIDADGTLQSVFPRVQAAFPRAHDSRIPFLVYDELDGAFYLTPDFRPAGGS